MAQEIYTNGAPEGAPVEMETSSVGLTRVGESLGKIACWGARKFFLIGLLATGIMALPTTADVFCRYFFHFSVEGVIEVEEILLVLLTFGALAVIQAGRGHIIVDFVVGRLSPRHRLWTELFNATLGTALFSLMAWCLQLFVQGKFASGETTFVLLIPLYLPVMFAAVGALLLAFCHLSDFLIILGKVFENRDFLPALLMLALAVLLLCSPWLIKGTELAANKLLIGGLGFGLLMCLLALGTPIGLGMALIGALGMVIVYPTAKPALSMLGMGPYSTASTYLFTVVPMFILMGELALYSGISTDLFKAADTWLGRLPGGLAVASVTGCAGFAAVCGDSMATAVTMASVSLPEMRKKNYDPGLACACLAAGGTLGILIPPSVGFIFYALVTEESIGRLFVAGIIPGLLLTGIFIAIVVLFAKKHPHLAPAGEPTTFKEKLDATKGIVAMLLLIVLILGGILSGIFSPNEGGAVGAFGTFLYAVARRRLPWKNLKKAITSSTLVTVKLIYILIGVGILGYFFAATRLPFMLANLVTDMDVNRWVIFATIVLVYIILGCMMNVIPMILLTLPALFPTVKALGFDPIWFGVVTVVLMEMGQITPPVGINIFALSSIATDVSMMYIFRRVVPFFFGMLLLVVILSFFPELATWLPSVLI